MDSKKGADALKAIIRQYPEALKNRSLLKALLLDFLPNERLLQNTILMIFDEDIHSAIQEVKGIETFDLLRYMRQLKAGYGVNDETARDAIQIWCDSFGIMSDFEKLVVSDESSTPSSGTVKREVVWKDSADVGDYEFEAIPGGLRIIKFIGFDELEIAIPNMINGKKVLSVGNYAFRGCRSIGRIIVPEGVTEIGNGAFKSLSTLKEVTLPETLRRIGSDDTTGFVPDSVFGRPRIEGAFSQSGIEKIAIPDSVAFLGEQTFLFCDSLSAIKLSNNLKTISKSAFCGAKIINIDLPQRVETIGAFAFFSCTELQSVSMPYGVKRIESCAFKGCIRLSQIVIPSTVEYIDKDAFCESLTIYCDAGSYAMKYAREHCIKCAKK